MARILVIAIVLVAAAVVVRIEFPSIAWQGRQVGQQCQVDVCLGALIEPSPKM